MTSKPHPLSVRAGAIAARVMREIVQEIKPGVKLYRICNTAEKKIVEYGGLPAFPACVSLNEVVAHYTSPPRDRAVIPDWGLVKIDIGVHVDGYIADTARTVDIDGTISGFIDATDDALQEAIEMMTPGRDLGDIGSRIAKVIKAYGLRPVKNMSGHSIEQFKLYAGKIVPNEKKRGIGRIESGEYYAIEPYATTGRNIQDSKNIYMFSNTGLDRGLKGVAEKLRLHLLKKYGPLPFALRWIGVKEESIDLVATIRELLRYRVIKGHPVIYERSGRPVSQSEDTIFISETGPIVLTR